MDPNSEAFALIENVCKTANTVLLNKHQCKRMADRISAIGEVLYKNFVSGKALQWSSRINDHLALGDLHRRDTCGSDSSTEADFPCSSSGVVVASKYPQPSNSREMYQWCGSVAQGPSTYNLAVAFSKLLTILRRGDSLLSSYKDWKGIVSKISKTDNRGEFKEIHDELDAIKSQFHNEGMNEGFVNEFELASETDRNLILAADAEKDLQELPKLLEKMCPTPESNPEVQQRDDSLIASVSSFPLSSPLGSLNEGGSQGSDSEDILTVSEILKIDPLDVKLGRQLGSRSSNVWATVFEATWLGCAFAVKKFTVGRCLPIQDVQRELDHLIYLRHPNIVQVVGSMVNSEMQSSIVMEYMGGDLRTFIASRMQKRNQAAWKKLSPSHLPFDDHERMVIISKIANGMAYLHSRGIVHGNLTLSSVLVQEHTGWIDVKIADFGMAKFIETREPQTVRRLQSTLGSRQNLAADVYGFGALCFEVLTGTIPYYDCKVDYNQMVSGYRPPVLPVELDIGLRKLILRCCDSKAFNRPSFQDITATLTTLREQLSTVTNESSPEMHGSSGQSFGQLSRQLAGEDLVVNPVEQIPKVPAFLRRIFGLMGGKKGPIDSPAYKLCLSDIDREQDFLLSKTKKTIARFVRRMKELLGKVKIWHSQCDHLFKKYLEGVNMIEQRLDGLNAAEGGVRILKSPLDSFISSMMDGESLLCFCGGNYYKKAGFALSSPPPTYPTFSRFGLLLRGLDWTLEFFCYVEQKYVYKSGLFNSGWEWCEKRCRPVLRGNHGVRFGTREDEVLEADVCRQACDREALLKSLDSQPLRSSMFCGRAGALRFKPENLKSRKDQDVFKTVLRKRLQPASENLSPSSASNWFWIDKPELKHIKHLANGASKITDKSVWLGQIVAVGITKYLKDPVVEEAYLLATVQHSNIVEFLGFTYEEGTGYFVTEYMEQDLESLIKQRQRQSVEGPPFEFLVVVDILLQIVEAMVHAKNCRVIHRDLKPQNCLVSPKHQRESHSACSDIPTYYTVKVIDFGAAKMRGDDSYFGTCNRGTPFYMAPEVYRKSQKEYTWFADVYSFGMTCYHVVTGKAPFKEFTKFEEVQDFIMKGDRPEFPFECPGPLKELITRCWTSVSTHRPTFEDIRQYLWQCKLDFNLNLCEGVIL